MAAPRIRLRFARTGQVRDVAEFRRDGWPICPGCNEDELAAIRTIHKRQPTDVDFCYRCGDVEVISSAEPASGDLNLEGSS